MPVITDKAGATSLEKIVRMCNELQLYYYHYHLTFVYGIISTTERVKGF